MADMIKRNLILAGAIAIVVVINMAVAGVFLSGEGSFSPLISAAESPVLAMLMTMIALAASVLVGAMVARAANTAVGLFVVGCGVFVLAAQLDGPSEAIRLGGGIDLITETILWAVPVLGAVWVVFRIGGPLPDIEPDALGHRPHPFHSRSAWLAAAAGVLVIPSVWLIARTPMNGQLLAAVIVGAMLSGLAGRLVSPHVQPMLLFVSPIVFGGLGQVIGIALTDGPLEQAAALGELHPLCRPTPLVYVAGALIGVSLGLGWARSFLHHEESVDQRASTPIASA